MIVAEHRNWARLFFGWYINRIIRKNFSHYYVVNALPEIDPALPLVVTPNHISWWDGFIPYAFVQPRLHRRFFIMMLERELARYRFLRHLGAFSIAQGNRKSARETIDYFQTLLADPRNIVFFFPQGKIEPQTKQDPTIEKGLPLFLKGGNPCQVLILGLAISYYNEKHPEIFLRFGDLLDSRSVVDDFEGYRERFRNNFRALREAVETRVWQTDIIRELGWNCYERLERL